MEDERAATLVRFVRENVADDARIPVTPTTRLLSEGVLDSVGVVRLAAFVEEEFRVRFDDSEIRSGGCETIADILAVVDRRRASGRSRS